MADSTKRFSQRVEDYVRSRPGYPPEVVSLLRSACSLAGRAVVADIGSGTGIFARLLLQDGLEIFAVEPNACMRAAAESALAAQPGFHSVEGSAEATGLPDECVDLVSAAQAFHWFDRDRAKTEFRRILRPAGHVAIIWNDRMKSVDAFHSEYEELLLRWGTDYKDVDHSALDDSILVRFFGPFTRHTARFDNAQALNLAALQGRLLSSSYVPPKTHPDCAPMLAHLVEIFRRHANEGTVTMRYTTIVHLGRMR